MLGRRRPRALPFLFAGTAVVPLAFTLAGLDWWDAYHLLAERCYQGAGGFRPYGYWVWANLACAVLVVGPATAAGLRRLAAVLAQGREGLRPVPARERPSPVPDMSRPSAEVRLALLVLVVFLALLLNHLLLTGW
ncbi:hypothetical protein ACWD26_21735 [Streptomyces sp. NPDC002787]